MSPDSRFIDFGSLPSQIPIFPLTGALLLPGGNLPLNIFEPRYLAMIEASLAKNRWLGIVQPRDANAETVTDTHPLFNIGCLGKIVDFSETNDRRYLITVNGVCRFTTHSELRPREGYRQVIPEYEGFHIDFEAAELQPDQRKAFSATLKRYFDHREHNADWEALDQTPDDILVASIAMACPLNPAEKQALLEAHDLSARAACLIAILEMAVHANDQTHGTARH